ncbi:MAG TPA: ABC transporter permease [Gemmatimonadales bacterium]|nr:ABC transporter permease [Gemmatimonadales bacterium]
MRRRFRLPGRSSDIARDVERELRFHLDMRTEELIERGMRPEAARLEALRAFGDVGAIEGECRTITARAARERARRATMNGLLHDLRFALRSLRKSPGFTLAAVLTLALGIGANTAVFSMIRGVLLRPLPYENGERLVYLRQPAPLAGVQNAQFSVPELVDYRQRSRTLASIVEYHSMPFILLGRGEPRRVQTGVVSANYFDVLGVRPLLGRVFRAGEDQPGAEPVLVLSHAFWQNRLGGDPGIVGRTFEMNDRIHTVVGVLPPVPQYPAENDVYMPASSCPFRSSPFMLTTRTARPLHLFGRLAPATPLAGARAELEGIAAVVRSEHPGAYPAGQGFSISVASLHEELTRGARPTLLLLIGTTGFVLLIACANIANLTLARLTRRSREMALRSALGADRARLFRQMLVEGGLLALAGGVLGLALAAGTMRLLTGFAARFTVRAGEIALDAQVLAFTLAVCVLTGLAFAILPALPSRTNLVAALKEGGAAVSGGGSHRIRAALVVAQVAVSMVLLVGAGLLLRSLLALQALNPGFDTERVLTMTLDLDWSRYTTDDLVRGFHDRLHARLAAQAGVVATASSLTFPLDGHRRINVNFLVEGQPPTDDGAQPLGDLRSASPDYFHTLGIPLVTGRLFTPSDGPDAPSVAIVNQTLARRHWGTESPVGRRISADTGKTWITIVGVVGDVRHYDLESEPSDEVYLPFAQLPFRESTFLVRTTADPGAMARRIAAEVLAIDAGQPVANVRTLEELRGEALASPRLTTTLLLLFALLALCITAAGLGGVVAFSVSQRTQEIGVRMALGASRSEVLGMVLREGLRLVGVGLLVGIAAAILLTRLMAELLFHVDATDPFTFAVMGILLLLIAAAACLVPARRASSVDPLVALRAG